jgi:DNA-binding response OmpR family regulator
LDGILSLLLIDDDIELCTMMREYFAEVGHKLECAYDGRSGLSLACSNTYDLLLLDLMLPICGGFEVLRELKSSNDTPVIMLTTRTGQQDRINGLDSGADDYLPKPFDPDELLARIRAVLRRSRLSERVIPNLLRSGDIEINKMRRSASIAGRPGEFTALEFDLLALLVARAGNVISREEIAASLFARETTPYDRALDVHVSHLRKKLEGSSGRIRSIRGVGYVFNGAE